MNKLWAVVFCVCLFTNCHTSSKNDRRSLQTIPADIRGNFTDDYDISYTINDSVWIQHPGIKYHLLKYDATGKYFIARNDNKNPSEAGLYSRIDISYFTNMEPYHWGFCLTAYKANSVAEAVATPAADRANPKKGCGGYPFSRMKRAGN